MSNQEKQHYSLLLLAAFYIVGVLGMGLGWYPELVFWTPLNLMVSFLVVLWNQPRWNREMVFFLCLCFAMGLLVEIVGVQSGLIFGEYSYGPVLGWKIWDTPLMIGINWALLAYCTGASINRIFPDWHWLMQALAGALLMVCLDFFIEPVAVHYDMWSWGGGPIPLQNYIAWFLVSLVLLSVFHYLLSWVTNKVADYLLIMQFLFFWILGQLL